ncbi:quinoprotein dehydrogenase-associated SoxYZ-like carrier [Thauera sinica]|uniref:Quinoprotein dehydrogenase-associated SoxYZ-like carrier n=1 Tax=Thauera sinica TaxID=2665146 RepID=A0ABW1AQ99_9RHOO|nr:quinoprotein dehydrogenase-associated SoxYZ-like carrier [Thauera sp. K11]ATE62499.1 quinoprotein dehydrogenase-associated SoxYZ-like carrier [Thauera sp. K11]
MRREFFADARVVFDPRIADADPLESSRWEDMRREFFADARVVFDPRIAVTAPFNAEDPLNVPVSVDASALPGVDEVIVFADFNPIVKVLGFEPFDAAPTLGFRLKLQQSSPVRAAARTADGVWHVGGAWVRTHGGGCTLPSAGSSSPLWQQHLNRVSARLWPGVGHGERLRLRVIHPMDTGLAPGIPAFHIEELAVADAAGKALVRIRAYEPVSENPVFTLDLRPGAADAGPLRISGRDNNGNRIDAQVQR